MSYDVERILKSNRRIAKFARKSSRRPTLKAIHNLRTSTRHLETIFSALALDSKPKVKRLLRHLEALRKRAGKVRDMDVLTADALTVKQKDEQDCLIQLLEHLGAKRSKYAATLRCRVDALKPNLRRDLRRTVKRVERLLKESQNDPVNSDALSATTAKAITLSSELNRPARLARSNLHPYRLKVKELRDVLQLSNQAGVPALVAKLGEVKDAIGEWHDWEELVSIAKPLLDHGSACQLLKHLTETSNARYEHALSLTRELRNSHLRSKGFRLTLGPVNPPHHRRLSKHSDHNQNDQHQRAIHRRKHNHA